MNIGLIFDMDGTMVDNMLVHNQAWQKKLAELGLDLTLEEVKAECHGINEEIIIRLFGDRFNKEERDRISWEKEATYREIFKERLKLIDGYHNLLSIAYEKGIPMGIGTAASIENVNFVLDEMNIRQFFKAIVCDKDVTKGKPDPEVFLKVAGLLGITPATSIVFEDSPTGAEAARRAEMKAVIITTTHQADEFGRFPNIIEFRKDYTGIDLAGILEGYMVK